MRDKIYEAWPYVHSFFFYRRSNLLSCLHLRLVYFWGIKRNGLRQIMLLGLHAKQMYRFSRIFFFALCVVFFLFFLFFVFLFALLHSWTCVLVSRTCPDLTLRLILFSAPVFRIYFGKYVNFLDYISTWCCAVRYCWNILHA